MQRGAGGQGAGECQDWGEVVPCGTNEKEKSGGHQTRETREGDKNKKKNGKNPKDPLTTTKCFFLQQNWLRSPGLPIKHLALPFGP